MKDLILYRLIIAFVILGLIVSGLTAFPLEWAIESPFENSH